MNSEDSHPETPQELARQLYLRLPEHLRFIGEAPDMKSMDLQELKAWGEEYLGKLRRHREELIAHQFDADKIIAEVQPRIEKALKLTQQFEEADEKYLQLNADVADAKHDLFKKMDEAVKQAEEENPFHPQVQEWKENLEELRKHMPKE